MSFYRNILKQAWQLTWRNKYLWLFGIFVWLFGIFAAFFGDIGEFEFLFYSLGGEPSESLFPSWSSLASTGVFSWHTLINIGNLFKYDTLNIMVFLIAALMALAVLLFLVWLFVVSQAAIVASSAAIIKQKKNTLRDGLAAGILNFWPVLFLNILIKAAVYTLLATISWPLIFSSGLSANLFYILAFIIALPAAIILSFIMKYAIAYVVINKSRAGQALKQAWRLFKENWLISLEMAIILFMINLFVRLTGILAILALAVPFLFLGLIFSYSLSVAGAWLVAVSAFICFLFIVLAIGTTLSVFQIASWTVLFLELNKKRGASKLVRIVNGLIK